MDFREIAKEYNPGQIPIHIGDLIRERAARERKSLSAMCTELYCIALRLDPRDYGIEPTPRRKSEPASAR